MGGLEQAGWAAIGGETACQVAANTDYMKQDEFSHGTPLFLGLRRIFHSLAVHKDELLSIGPKRASGFPSERCLLRGRSAAEVCSWPPSTWTTMLEAPAF